MMNIEINAIYWKMLDAHTHRSALTLYTQSYHPCSTTFHAIRGGSDVQLGHERFSLSPSVRDNVSE